MDEEYIMTTLSELPSDLIQYNYNLSTQTNTVHQIHCHNVYEIYYFIEGDVDYLVEGKLYHPMPHSLILLSPHVFHGVKVNSDKPYRRFTIHFDPNLLNMDRRSLLLSAFPSYEKHSVKEVYYENTDSFHLYTYCESLINLNSQPDFIKNQLLPTHLEAILAQLTIMCQTLSPVQVKISVSSTITDIITYLNDNLTKNITLDQLSEYFFISKYYLNRAFRKATGTTVGDYLIYKRVIYAQQLLMNGYLATEAALNSGFRDYSAFYRAYRKNIGHSPLVDRRDIPRFHENVLK
jgi:AraC-like DNA-binding protein